MNLILKCKIFLSISSIFEVKTGQNGFQNFVFSSWGLFSNEKKLNRMSLVSKCEIFPGFETGNGHRGNNSNQFYLMTIISNKIGHFQRYGGQSHLINVRDGVEGQGGCV